MFESCPCLQFSPKNNPTSPGLAMADHDAGWLLPIPAPEEANSLRRCSSHVSTSTGLSRLGMVRRHESSSGRLIVSWTLRRMCICSSSSPKPASRTAGKPAAAGNRARAGVAAAAAARKTVGLCPRRPRAGAGKGTRKNEDCEALSNARCRNAPGKTARSSTDNLDERGGQPLLTKPRAPPIFGGAPTSAAAPLLAPEPQVAN